MQVAAEQWSSADKKCLVRIICGADKYLIFENVVVSYLVLSQRLEVCRTHTRPKAPPGNDDDDDFVGESETVIARNIVLLKYCTSKFFAEAKCANTNCASSLELHD